MFKKLLSWALVLCLLLALLPGSAFAAGGTWSGSGAENDPYIIEDAADLLALAASVNGGQSYADQYFRLWKDVDLTGTAWTPIGGENRAFAGTFLGKGHSITGLSVYGGDCSGLFGNFSGRLQDLSVSGSVTGGSNTGGIAGKNTGLILNCDFTGSVAGGRYTGGLAGENTGRIENCVSRAAVTGAEDTGGIAGSSSGKITSCTNDGPVTCSGNKSGGIAGSSGGTVSACLNAAKGTITGKDMTGGMVGTAKGTVENCTNQAVVIGGSSSGGIVGSTYGSCAISGCLNSGKIDCQGSVFIGGILGEDTNESSEYISVTGCTNTGEVIGTGDYLGTTHSFTGGILGWTARGAVKDCLNTGAVTGLGESGGIVGVKRFDFVENCTNTGAVTGSSDQVGGIGGQANAKGCINKGTVSGTKTVGGIVGFGSTFRDCLNSGTVTGTSTLGGIVGHIDLYGISNCRNTGTIGSDSASQVGGVVGYLYKTSMEHCVNEGTVFGNERIGGVVGQTTSASTVKWCRNSGPVTGSGNQVGGIVACSGSNMAAELCVNSGAVTGAENVGGILGVLNNAGSKVYQCRNDGRITGTGLVGGIAGSGTNPTAEQCGNTGTVTSSGYDIGGILGQAKNGGTFRDCFDLGIVFGQENVGGILGYAWDTAELTRTYCKAPNDGENGYEGVDCVAKTDGTIYAKVGALIGQKNKGTVLTLRRNYWWDRCTYRALGWTISKYDGDSITNHNYYDYFYYEVRFVDPDYVEEWDWTNVWYADTNAKQPRLRWESTLSINSASPTESTGGSGGAGGQGNTVRVLYLTGSGTEADPFRVTCAEDWNEVADALDGGADLKGCWFEQAGDLSVARMMGSQDHPFEGVYDGGCHILAVELSSSGYFCAPFSTINNTTLRHIRVSGTVKGGMHCAGLAGGLSGKNTVIDCLVGTDIITAGTHCGGILGHCGTSNTTMEGCVFTGSITAIGGGGQNVGVLWGWSDSGARTTMSYCMEAGTGYSGCTGLNPIGLGAFTGNLLFNYVTHPRITTANGPDKDWGDKGIQAYKLTGAPGVSIDYDIAYETREYPACVLEARGWFLHWCGIDYVPALNGINLPLKLSCELAEGEELLRWRANAGEVVPYGDGWSINLAATETMPKEGITLTPVTRTVLVQGDTLTYTYEFPSDGSYADVIAAWYDANGAMQGCTMESIRCSGLRTAALKVKANAAKYKLFLLDSASKPIEIVWES